MTQNEELLKTLMELGLTFLQAKTYLTLSNFDKAEVKTIAKISQVARQDIYRIMPELQKMGLAEKIIATPVMFRATPLKEGFTMLINKKMEENKDIQKRTQALLKNYERENECQVSSEEFQEFIITSERALFLKNMREAISEAKTSKKVCLRLKDLETMLFLYCQDLKQAAERGVNIQVLTEKTEKIVNLQAYKSRIFEVRCTSEPIPVSIDMYDNREVNIQLAYNQTVPNLWTNNANLVKIAEIYFEHMWNKAQEFKTP
jgi:sugar-specific transcriptional regulator TrmB